MMDALLLQPTMEDWLAAVKPWERKPDCEYTAPGSETEGVDCWEKATVRHVNAEGVTVAVFCDEHNEVSLQPGRTVETIIYHDHQEG